MSDDRTPSRAQWLRERRAISREQEDALAPVYDERWGEIEPLHRSFIERFLDKLPPNGSVLDAACGTGKYFGLVLDSGRSLIGVDQAAAIVAIAAAKWPAAQARRCDLQELDYDDEFDGVMCVDAMEFIPPEDWPNVLNAFHRALRPGGWLYLTVELNPPDVVRRMTDEARSQGLPLVEGEVIWDEDDGPLYHHYPGMPGVRDWMQSTGFVIAEDVEGPWNEQDDYAYHHVLAHRFG